jgi:hypothetical protein
VFTTKNNSYGPTEMCCLEHNFCAIAKKAKQYIVKNANDPSHGTPTAEKESELENLLIEPVPKPHVLGRQALFVLEPLKSAVSQGVAENF